MQSSVLPKITKKEEEEEKKQQQKNKKQKQKIMMMMKMKMIRKICYNQRTFTIKNHAQTLKIQEVHYAAIARRRRRKSSACYEEALFDCLTGSWNHVQVGAWRWRDVLPLLYPWLPLVLVGEACIWRRWRRLFLLQGFSTTIANSSRRRQLIGIIAWHTRLTGTANAMRRLIPDTHWICAHTYWCADRCRWTCSFRRWAPSTCCWRSFNTWGIFIIRCYYDDVLELLLLGSRCEASTGRRRIRMTHEAVFVVVLGPLSCASEHEIQSCGRNRHRCNNCQLLRQQRRIHLDTACCTAHHLFFWVRSIQARRYRPSWNLELAISIFSRASFLHKSHEESKQNKRLRM